MALPPSFPSEPVDPAPGPGGRAGIASRSRSRSSGHIPDARGRPTHGCYCNQFSPILLNKSWRSRGRARNSFVPPARPRSQQLINFITRRDALSLPLSPNLRIGPSSPLSSLCSSSPRSCLGPNFPGRARPSARRRGGDHFLDGFHQTCGRRPQRAPRVSFPLSFPRLRQPYK